MVCTELVWGTRVEGLLVLRWDLQRSSSREEASVAAMWAAMSISDLQGRGGEGRGEERRGGETRGEGKRKVERRGPCGVD